MDEQCPTCGCIIGGGCPESTDEDRALYILRHAPKYGIQSDEQMEIDWAKSLLTEK